MSDPFARLRRFLRELKRRNVYRVAVTYAVVGFVLIQVADLTFVRLGLPSWTVTLVIVLVAMGFPLAMILAWAFEMTPEGMRRTADAEIAPESESMPADGRRAQSRLAMKALVGLGLVGAAVAGGWYLMGGGEGTEPAPRLGDRSIAVLPFEALGQQEPDAFTEGMHDDLLARLSNVSGLKVISRTAVEQYRGTNLSTGDIADSLGVRWVLEGGVQEMGDQIQVNAQLIDPRTETHAWAETYQRDLTAQDLFALQGEITRKIARSLEAELTPEEAQQVERRPTEDLDAYKLYVRGRRRLDTRTEEGMRDAVDYFRRAIAQDSSYALAWSGLADAIGLYPEHGPDTVPASFPEHEKAARRALELAPDLAEAHASMGLVHWQQRNAPLALQKLQRAVELKPSYAQAHHWLGLLLFDIGRLEAAHERQSLAVQLNPQNAAARGTLILALIAQRKLATAKAHLERLSGLSEEFRRGVEGIFLYHIRQWDELETLAQEQLKGEDSSGHFKLARIAVLRGDTAAARNHLAELRETEAYFPVGLTYAALGETDAAFSAWEKVSWKGAVLSQRALRYFYSDVLDPLRDDPRYGELIREINQYWGLNPDGSIPDSVDVSLDGQADE